MELGLERPSAPSPKTKHIAWAGALIARVHFQQAKSVMLRSYVSLLTTLAYDLRMQNLTCQVPDAFSRFG